MVPLQVVAEIIAAWTGIPLGKMVKNEIATVLNLKPLLQERVIGQDHEKVVDSAGCACSAGAWCTGPQGGIYCLKDDGQKKYKPKG